MDVNHADFWESNYRDARLNWDLGGPTPVFRALAEEGAFPAGRLIVLGAGLGHDARLFARHGHEVTALDFAPGAARAMRALQDPAHPVDILQADFFSLPQALDRGFDAVLEYVFYCAIDPARRPDYAKTVARLLRPGGRFIGLIFPTDERPGGPPFTSRPEELIALLEGQGLALERRETRPETIKPRRGREELVVMRRLPG
jgi:SAM-dependent methyltransferase